LIQTGKRGEGRGADARVLRIIGGRWRGRKLRFPADAAIRPTPDRVRETLFNWLQMEMEGVRCLDLFAGSGALGLEALSRGAAHVTFVEQETTAARALQRLLGEWLAPDAVVKQMDALRFLGEPGQPFDIVFLDPPFASGLLTGAVRRLATGGRLAPGARVYVEYPSQEGAPALPEGWARAKTKQAGEVGYDLWVAGDRS
jgi:16S rRNA (guanine966-N2)-methyltransferase